MVTILRLTIGVALLTATHLGMAQAWQTNNRTISITTGLMQQDYQEYDNHQRVDNGILNTEKSDIHEFAINTRYQHTHQGLWLQGRATHVTGATNYDGFLQQGNQLIPYQSITDNTMYKLSANVGYALPVGEKIQLIPNIGGQHQRWDRQLSQYDERFTQRSVSAGIVAQYQATPNIGLEVSAEVGKQINSDIKVPQHNFEQELDKKTVWQVGAKASYQLSDSLAILGEATHQVNAYGKSLVQDDLQYPSGKAKHTSWLLGVRSSF